MPRGLVRGGKRGVGRGPDLEFDVVFTVRTAVAATDPLGVTDEGEKEQVAAVGKGVPQLRDTDWLKPLEGMTLTV